MPTFNFPIIVDTTQLATPPSTGWKGLVAMLSINQNGSVYTGSVNFLKPSLLAGKNIPLSNPTLTNGTLQFGLTQALSYLQDPSWNRSQPQYTFTAPWDGQSSIIAGGKAWLPVSMLNDISSGDMKSGVQTLNCSTAQPTLSGDGSILTGGQFSSGASFNSAAGGWVLGNGDTLILTLESIEQGVAPILMLMNGPAVTLSIAPAGANPTWTQLATGYAAGGSSFYENVFYVQPGTTLAGGSQLQIKNTGNGNVTIQSATIAY